MVTIIKRNIKKVGPLKLKIEEDGIRVLRCDASAVNVVIPEGVTSIYSWAFYNCIDLESIEIPSTLTTICDVIFRNCSKLQKINVSNNNTILKSINGVLYERTNLDKVRYPYDSMIDPPCDKNILVYPQGKADKEFTIPDGVVSVNFRAFNCCSYLRTIVITKNVVDISPSAFYGCIGIEEFKVEEENNKYKSIDGVLYSNDSTILCRYPAGKKEQYFEVPDYVERIGDDAFSHCKHLLSVAMHSNISFIGKYAFAQCVSLSEVVIPNGIKEITQRMFYDCVSLQKIILPDSIERICHQAFWNCKMLNSIDLPKSIKCLEPSSLSFVDEVHIHSRTPVDIQSIMYSACSESCVLYVPWGSKELYIKDSRYSRFAQIKAER